MNAQPIFPEAGPPLLEVRDLVKHHGRVRAVDGVSFAIKAGETVGLVGESGCGKSTLGRAIMGLAPLTGGEVRLDGQVISDLPYAQVRPLRKRMQMVFQDPYASLNPRRTVGTIIEEPLKVHGLGSAKARRAQVLELMARVGLPADAASRFPHEFSGGQRQRVGIARALALNPALIVADEPVSALDVSVQAQVINLMVRLQKEMGLSYLFISHDLAVVHYIADRILVMYLGKIVEMSDRDRVWKQPLHPYTAGLLAAHPSPDPESAHAPRLRIEGDMPSPTAPPPGCRFHTRCPFKVELCTTEEPALRPLPDGRTVACHLVTVAADGTAHSPTEGGEVIPASRASEPASAFPLSHS
ncbi:ABC transporter ATP-binding protein [Azorhizobium oxalatiphilum]|uniref:ABC transporter ATP-binding protein n=1 Tax=Azorhizobium oxalatiphilum TaxID=980631 RepID=A0A917C8S5_9HYPH|nr:dipeptide ABC transporter ATP-binding protein [Azorhizobium oxalatiphilum]GGF77276.1 ABC transporter ATP-binding protein [Azorhizobium oxalatiphilum]